MNTERAKSKIGRWVDETMKGKFDNFVGSRKKSSTNLKLTNDIPTPPPDSDENNEVALFNTEIDIQTLNSVSQNEMTKPPVTLDDIDLSALCSNLTRKQHLQDVIGDERPDIGRMIQTHGKLLMLNMDSTCNNKLL
ncbi:uncharacterized protein LOC126846246 [Adelges cooleyi]|uniref:uncharacterized protein LOC126846246 n=1 Tax=Adelges cooleyi TaxID=133065 RepID=UPI00217F41E0|nr:uncharacterized protein LOC126846246 [Adelges cooleyi]